MFSFLGKTSLIVLCTLYAAMGHSQNFPVQVIPQAVPPAPIYLSNYADASTVNSPLRVQLILNDFTIPSREIRLKTYVQGNGISFQSNDIVVGATPLFLEGGTPLILTNVELAPYFQFENIIGIPPNVYGQPIPEGAYQFCFEVFDVLTGNRLSDRSCAVSVVFQNEPPFLVLPRNKTNVEEINPQNIVFQWTPRSINVTNVEYELSLVEIWDNQVDPQQAFLSSPPVFQTTTTATTYVYGPAEPLLLSGKNYAWRVQAMAKQGTEEIGLFKNQGYSEIFSFSYAGSCDLPFGMNHEVKGSTNANIFWDDFSTDVPEYTVRYRQKGNDNEWFLSKTTTNQLTLWDLKAGTTYEYQLQKKCVITQSDWSITKEFTTFIADDEASVYECGITPNFSLANTDPLDNIVVGDAFVAGDFPVKILEVSGSNGRFTGKGYVTIPYLSNIKVAVEFTNVLINTDKQLAEGMVITKYNPSLGNILDVDDVVDTVGDVVDAVGDFVGGVVEAIEEFFENRDKADEIYSDGVITMEEIEELEKITKSNEAIIAEFSENPTPENTAASEILKQENTELNDVISQSNSSNESVSVPSSLVELNEAKDDIFKIKFNGITTEFSLKVDTFFPTVSGVPIKIPSVNKLWIEERGGIEKFSVNGVIYYAASVSGNLKGYYSKEVLENAAIAPEPDVKSSFNYTQEIRDALTGKEFKDYEIGKLGDEVFTIAKRFVGETAVDCQCEFRWNNNESFSSITGIRRVTPVPYEIAAEKNCEGSICDDSASLVAGGLGTNLYLYLIKQDGIENNPDRKAKLQELRDFLDSKTENKQYRLYSEGLKDYIGMSYYRTYFKDNEIYSKAQFTSHFKYDTNFARDIEIIFSTVDLRKDIVEGEYNKNSVDYVTGGKYEYSYSDLVVRNNYLYTGDIVPGIAGLIRSSENDGIAQAISQKDGYDQYVAIFGTDSALFFIAFWTTQYAKDLLPAYFLRQVIAEYGTQVTIQFIKEKGKDVLKAVAFDASLQLVTNYYFNNETQFNFDKSLDKISKLSLLSSAAKSLATLSYKQEVFLDCLEGGFLDTDNDKLRIQFNAYDCVRSAIVGLILNRALDQASSFATTIVKAAKDDPSIFINGMRKLLNDIGEDQANVFRKNLDEFFTEFNIPKTAKLNAFIRGEKLHPQVKSQAESPEGKEVIAKSGTSEIAHIDHSKNVIAELAMETGKIGANISLDFYPKIGDKVQIRAILQELSDGSYKIVFPLNKVVNDLNLNSFLDYCTNNRKDAFQMLSSNNLSRIKLIGNNAQDAFGKTNIDIAIADLEVHSLNTNGSVKQNKLQINGIITFQIGDIISNIAIKNIKQGTNGKYALIGRSMGNETTNGLRNIYEELLNNRNLNVEIFDSSSLSGDWKVNFDAALAEFARETDNWTKRLSNQELIQLKMYQLNKDWAQKLVDEGYTVLDMGDFNNLGFSVFYAMEKNIIFN